MATPKEFKNRRAYHDYHVLDKLEAGIVLIGSEVKALREGNLSFAESYARIENGEAFIQGLHISEYKNARMFGHEATRRRKLLLHKREIRKLYKSVSIRGQTLIPLKVYFNKRGIAKVLLGICKGKHSHDKRAAKRKRDSDREIRREISKYSG